MDHQTASTTPAADDVRALSVRGVRFRGPQWIGASGAMAAFVMMFVNFVQGDTVVAAILLVLLTLLFGSLLWWTRPGRGAHTTHAAAQAAAAADDVIIYWRPGCMHCDRLKLALRKARQDASWVNIARDTAAARFVATQHDGPATVPTAITGAGDMIDPTPEAIRAQLRAAHQAHRAQLRNHNRK